MTSFDTGMPISTFKLIEHFNRHPDFLVSVLLSGEGELADRVRNCGIEPTIVPFHRLRSLRRFPEFIRFFLSFPQAFFRIGHYLATNDIDIVHFSDIIDMPFYACSLLARTRSVAHLRHCIESVPGRLIFNVLTLVCIDKVVCISHAVKRHSGLKDSRAMVLYNSGPDLALFNPALQFSRSASLPEKQPAVLAIGKFVYAKGHEHFVSMAYAIEKQHPGVYHFVIIGDKVPAHESYYTMVQNRIRASCLEQSFSILKYVPHEQMPAILAQTSVLVHLPNWQEGLGGAVLEAMAMNVPVVAFDSGGINECIQDNSSGFLVPQGDIDAATGKVLNLLHNPVLQKTVCIRAREDVVSKFSYKKHFAGIEHIYHLVLH